MTTLSGTPAATRSPRLLRLRGLTWLVWRQHRAAFWTMLGLTVVCVAWIAYQRAGMMHYLDRFGWPHPRTDDWTQGFQPQLDRLNQVGSVILGVPILLGVFVGAPLLAGDLENGTAKLVASQSVSRVRWLTAKLGITLAVVLVCTGALGVAYGWWVGPVKATSQLTWTDETVLDTTGPLPAALTLFTVVGGMAIGLLVRRVLMAMVVTFGFTVVLEILWVHFQLSLGSVVTVLTHGGVLGDPPQLPPGAYEVDQSYLTSSGHTVGWSTCSNAPTDKAHAACLASNHIVGWSVKYLPISRMSSMQWTGTAILVALSVAVVAYVLLRSRKRLV
ncbi:ABC transporter [Streptomyces sp. PTM05]|uniref:ABC transporter n=1 Tax=Streptantibioticus parmotrematis TaxID=2873249 RepID=A0ABS7QS59_9ACTN|nr:ABC transporter [Streptantibioticus parmotrematis]MBY8886029.1 ABC transporter [Streptantibioticus parmotrematis]